MLGEHPVFPILLSCDLARSRAFYHDLLGLEVIAESADRIVLRCGGGTQLVLTLSTMGTADTQTQMAWRVPDIRTVLAELRARGVPIQRYEAPDPVTDGDGVADMGHSWAAWIIDPDANALGIVQPKPVPTLPASTLAG
jgi:catechol 2,3-dioxygenase-like lactoylglutathione lyase family enzyme